MAPFKRISVLGDGGWGTTLALLLHKKGYAVTLWSAFKAYALYLHRARVNRDYLGGIRIPRGIAITSDLKRALKGDLLVLAVPSQYVRSVLGRGRKYSSSLVPIVSVSKGIENGSFLRISEVIKEVWAPKKIAVLSGPTIAAEVVRQVPSAAVVASRNRSFAVVLQDLFMTEAFRVYTNNDVAGVEFGGSLKNVIAVACGICDGLKYGTNTKAALLSRGLAEMARLGSACGAKKETFFGISGLGDLATTCFSERSRNRFVGEAIGRGKSLRRVALRMKMVAEGVPTARAAYLLSRKKKIEMPITAEVYRVLFRKKSPAMAVKSLMLRKRRPEY